MTDASRRVYLGLGRAFVAIGAIVALGSVLDRAFGWGFFRGSPVGTAAFLVLIGGLLLWTVRQADGRPAPTSAAAEGGDGASDEDAEAEGVATEAVAGTPGDEPLGPDRKRP